VLAAEHKPRLVLVTRLDQMLVRLAAHSVWALGLDFQLLRRFRQCGNTVRKLVCRRSRPTSLNTSDKPDLLAGERLAVVEPVAALAEGMAAALAADRVAALVAGMAAALAAGMVAAPAAGMVAALVAGIVAAPVAGMTAALAAAADQVGVAAVPAVRPVVVGLD
jgi:hypothetical protein